MGAPGGRPDVGRAVRGGSGTVTRMPQVSDVSQPTVCDPADVPHALSAQQLRFFDTFGFLRVPALFTAEIETITEGFEAVFAENPTWDTNAELHFDDRRSIIPAFIDKSEQLSWLRDDPRVVGIVSSVLGPDYEYAESDGNCFYCDTSWHADIYSAPIDQPHLKLSFYLDPLTAASGAIRLIPGSNHHTSEFARALRRDLETPTSVRELFGVEPEDIPSWALETMPGDLVMWNFRTVHASFGGSARRRLFSVNFRAPAAPA